MRAWSVAKAAILADLGRLDEARAEFERLAENDFERIPQDAQWTISHALLTDAAAGLGDAERARLLRQRLAPYRGLVVVAGRSAAARGPVARYLGLAAETAGDAETAVADYEEAIAMSRRMGDRPFTAESSIELARVLLRRGGEGDAERAAELLDSSLDAAQRLRMAGTSERALALKLESQGLSGIDVEETIEDVIGAIEQERPDVRSYAAPDGSVTILFSDIESSTAMTERLGDERWLGVLRDHNSVFREKLNAHDGYEVKNQGDGFMLVFPSPVGALRCAIEVQRAFEERAAERPDERIRVQDRPPHRGGDRRGGRLLRAERDPRGADRRPGAWRGDPRLRGAARPVRIRGTDRVRRTARARAEGPGGDAHRLSRPLGAPGRGDERGLGLDSTNVPRDPRIVGCLAVLWGQWGLSCSWQPFFHRSPRASRTGPEYALGALRANGRPDAGFGPPPDHVVVDGISGDDHVNAAAAASGGRYYIAAESISGQARFGIGRFTAAGALDPGFGGGTITTTIGDNASPRAIAVRRDGKLLVAGRADLGGVAQIALVRYLPNGLPDPDFGGGDGVVTTKVGVGATGLDVEAAKGGKVVVVGGGGPASGEGLVLRYRSNGTLDQSFGTGGIVRVRVGKASTAFACEVGARGKIVVAGAGLGKVSGLRRQADARGQPRSRFRWR